MFGRTNRRREVIEPEVVPLGEENQVQLALDTVADILLTLGRHALQTDAAEASAFRRLAGAWASHVALAKSPPGTGRDGRDSAFGEKAYSAATASSDEHRAGVDWTEPGGDQGRVRGDIFDGRHGTDTSATFARRDWAGVRNFVRAYCEQNVHRVQGIAADLRQVVWIFIQNLNQNLAKDVEADREIQSHLAKLKALALSDATTELKKEALATVVRVSEVLEARRCNQEDNVARLGAQIRGLGEELEDAKTEAQIDVLTKVFNRKAFDDYLRNSLELARAFQQPTSVLMIDVDRLNGINDSLGRKVGDFVLQAVADTISRIFLRRIDFVARYGDDEFVVVLRETGLGDATGLAARVVEHVRMIQLPHEEEAGKVTVSIGVAALLSSDASDEAVSRADGNLFRAKRQGRDRFVSDGRGA